MAGKVAPLRLVPQDARVPSPLISVITPAYNIESYLKESAESVLAQTERDFEYLIVDDGSNDGTAAIAHSLAARDPRVRVIDGAHAGSAAGRNLGLREAKGSLVSFCDGDDLWAPTFLERMRARLQVAPEPVGAVFSAFSYIDQKGRLWGKTSIAEPGDYDANRMLAGHCPPGTGSCLLIKRSCFDEAGLFDESLHNCIDLDMWLKINTESTTPLFRFVPEVLVQWRVRPGSISSSESKRVDGLAEMFQRYGSHLSDANRVRAYAWPAVLAFYSGRDDKAQLWLNEVKSADPKHYLHSRNGAILGAFRILGPKRGRRVRSIAAKIVSTIRSVRMRTGV